MRLSGTKANSTNQYRGLGDQLYDLGGARPTLDLNFANNESLVDSVTGKNLVTHTRASSATYVDGDGNIQTAVTNYLDDSEGFNASAHWNKGPLAGTATDNAATAPDGSTTATLLVEDTTTNGRYIANGHSFVANKTYTVSCWVKQYSNTGTQDRHFGFLLNGASFSSEHQRAVFNLTDGSFTVTGVQSTTASIEAYPDGWYRCSLTATATISSTTGIQFRLTNDPTIVTNSWTGDGVSGIYIWGAQLEESSTVGEYVKTTGTINSAPRFDHDPVTGESLGLLIEEARTNLLSYSAADINNGWQTNSSETPVNLSLNKLGVFSGVRAISGGQTWQGIKLNTPRPQLVAGTTYTITVWWMYGDVNPSQKVRVTIKIDSISQTCAVQKPSSTTDPLDPNSYTLTNNAVHGTVSNVQAEDAGSDVIKLSFNFVPSSSATYTMSIGAQAHSVGASVIALGAQIEEGVNQSSYIPTSGSTVTRATDVASISGNDFGTFNLLPYSEEFDTTEWTRVEVVFQPNAITSPNNTFTANKITATGGDTEHNVRRSFTATSGGTYTFSCYLKAAGRNQYRLAYRIPSIWTGNTNQVASFNLTGDGSVSVVSGSATATIEAVGDGWYRCSITATAVASGIAHARIQDSFDSDGNGIYVWGAQLEESSTVTPYVKSDVTWTSRASNATYYDKDGVLRKSSYNSIESSEDFSATTWATVGDGLTVTTDQITAPNGTQTADLLTANSGSVGKGIQDYVAIAVVNQVYTASCYFKAGSTNYVRLHFQGGGQTAALAVDLSNGSVVLSDQQDDYNVEPLPNGWYRVSVTQTAISAVGIAHRVYVCNSDGATNGATGSIYAWGAQLEKGTYAGEYVKTEGTAASTARNVAFLPDGNGNFVSAGELLLENAGTNLVTYSEEFDQSTWSKVNSTVISNAAVAPDGTLTADKLVEGTATNFSQITYPVTFSNSTTYTFSMYAKAAENDSALLFFAGAGQYVSVEFNLTNGTTSLYSQNNTWSNVSSTISYVGNGWYRCSITSTSSSAVTSNVAAIRNTTGSTQGDGTSGIYVWGAQLEESHYATSYIPTSGATATRAADVSSSSSNTFGNSFYDQTEGTTFTDAFRKTSVPSGKFPTVAAFTDGTNQNRILNGWISDTTASFIVTKNGVSTAGIYPGTSDTRRRLATAFAINNFALALNGNTPSTDNSGVLPTLPSLRIGDQYGSHILNGAIRRITYWPQRLSNDTLQTITK
jgi:hypothetical protein